MIFFTFQVLCILSKLSRVYTNTVTSPQIRILDVATKASETRLIPNHAEYQNAFNPYLHQNRYENAKPLKSYVIYDEYPMKIFKEWKANSPAEFSASAPQSFLDLNRQSNAEFPSEYYFQNGPQVLPPPKPTLAYRSVYSNIIKVFDNSLDGLDRNQFQGERYVKPFDGNFWKPQPPIEYEHYPQDIARRQLYYNLKLPENFPKVFAPNEKFHVPSFDDGVPQPPKFFYPKDGFYDTYTINYDNENTRHKDEVELLPGALKHKHQKKAFLCGFIRVNQRRFPDSGEPCGRTDDLPIVHHEYPDYSNLPDDKIPVEHRRQHFQIKRIKRSELKQSNENRQKRNAFGYGYSSWGSPLSFSGYEGYFSDNYPTRAGYRNSYSGNRNRNQNYKNRYSGNRDDDYDDDYQNNDDSNNRGLSGYLTNGGRRYKNRKNNENYDDNDDDNNDNNRDDDSEEEMEQMNSNRRDNDRRNNNDDSRDRRRNNNNTNNNNNNNNNNNDDDDYRDSRRNNNRNNYNNSRRNNNNNNIRRNNNDRNDNRNRYYSNSNSNSNNNGYGSSYSSYGSNYGNNGGYGSSYSGNGGYGSSYGNGGYGSSYGGNGGYGSNYGSGGYGSSYGNNGGYGSYGSNGGYGYGGYGNGFSSF